MTTTNVALTENWQAVTNGTEDYALHVAPVTGSNRVEVTLNDGTPDDTTPFFSLKVGEGFSSITHPGKVWARRAEADKLAVLVMNK